MLVISVDNLGNDLARQGAVFDRLGVQALFFACLNFIEVGCIQAHGCLVICAELQSDRHLWAYSSDFFVCNGILSRCASQAS